mgnify:CR=1 FL=1
MPVGYKYHNMPNGRGDKITMTKINLDIPIKTVDAAGDAESRSLSIARTALGLLDNHLHISQYKEVPVDLHMIKLCLRAIIRNKGS